MRTLVFRATLIVAVFALLTILLERVSIRQGWPDWIMWTIGGLSGVGGLLLLLGSRLPEVLGILGDFSEFGGYRLWDSVQGRAVELNVRVLLQRELEQNQERLGRVRLSEEWLAGIGSGGAELRFCNEEYRRLRNQDVFMRWPPDVVGKFALYYGELYDVQRRYTDRRVLMPKTTSWITADISLVLDEVYDLG